MGRLLRITARLGLLVLAIYVVKRLLDARRPAPAGLGWDAVEPPSAVAPTPPPSTPVVPMVEPAVVEVGDVDQPGEPEVDTTEEDAPATKAPAKKAPAKKAAAKKAPAKKAAAKKAPPKKAAPPD